MSYEVRCACGNTHTVTAADAGSALNCSCGSAVNVPPLHVLRASAGEQAISPVVQIRGMLLRNELPGTRTCACCHRGTDEIVRVSVECERSITKSGASKAEYAGCLFGCALGVFMPVVYGVVALLFFLGLWTRPDKQFGDDVSVIVPLPVCSACRPDLNGYGLEHALCEVPVYRALLDRYPNALIRCLS